MKRLNLKLSMNIINNDRITRIVSVVLAVMLGVLFVSLMVDAATTISTSISTTGTLTVTGNSILATASTTGLVTADSVKVDGVNGSTVSSLVFGYCTLAAVDVTTASTTMGTCTPSVGASVLTASYRVWVQATSSMSVSTFITAASSTSAGTIQVRFHATNLATAVAAGTSLNFWAVR